MIKRYYSNYTGKQIDEAVKAIVENQVSLEDLSSELIAEIKRWIKEAIDEGGTKELVFANHYEFPNIGQANILYIATDESKVYFWSPDKLVYKLLVGDYDNVEFIICGGALENGNNN